MAVPIHPKVKAGGETAGVISALVAVCAVFGINIDVDTESALLVIAATVAPVIAGYLKSA